MDLIVTRCEEIASVIVVKPISPPGEFANLPPIIFGAIKLYIFGVQPSECAEFALPYCWLQLWGDRFYC